jgi:hypothetical protein
VSRNLKQRVSKLERLFGQKQGVPLINAQPGETKEQAIEKFLRENPRYRDSEACMIISTIEGGPTIGPPPRPGQEKSQAPHTPYRGGLSEDKPLQITR